MTTLDLRDEPALTLESARLSARLAHTARATVLVTYDQMVDIYTELQKSAAFTGAPAVSQCQSVTWDSLTFRTELND